MAIEVTSAITYREIEAEGITSALQTIVYDCILEHGPLTAGEMYAILGKEHYSYHKRLSELEKLGYIRCSGKLRCNASNRMSKVWEVDDND